MRLEVIGYIFLFFILLFLQPEKNEVYSPGFNILMGVMYAFLLTLFLMRQRKGNRNWLRPDVIFLIGFTIVHIQIPFFEAIGIEPYMPEFIWINKNVVNYATWMSVLAICSWIIGYSYFTPRIFGVYEQADFKFRVNFYYYDFLLSILFLTFLFLVGKEFLRGAYDTGAWGGGASYLYLIIGNMLYLRIVYFFSGLPRKTAHFTVFKEILKNKIFSIVLLTYCVMFTLTGSRGEILNILLVMAAAYALFVKPISMRALVLYVSIGAFVFTILGAGRGKDYNSFSGESIFYRGYEAFSQEDNNKGITSELASSVRIQYRAIDTVPEKHPYLYGSTYVTALTATVPFLTGAYIDLFSVPPQYTSSSRFFTYLGQGAYHTYGEGSEILSDIYINFGSVCVFLFMFLFGALMGLVNTRARKFAFPYILIYVALTMSALYINRSYLLLPLSNIVYLYALHLLFSRRKNRNERCG
tara:strand:- start:1256 stop:2662 length:1407 start_codon:yes stop_codon:yes gene_type:complete